MIYYNQADNRWANYPYPSQSLPRATIKSGGCGPTSCAMIVASLKTAITPKEMARLFLDNGQRGEGGTKASAFSWTAKQFGIKMFQTSNINQAVENLKNGGMCIAHCNAGGVFSTGGHYIVLGYMRNNNTIVVLDPYLYKNKFNTSSRKGKVIVKGNDVDITIDNFRRFARCSTIYCYQPIQQKENTTLLCHVKTLTDKKPLRTSPDASRKDNIIAYMKKGTELDIYEFKNEFGRAPQGWVILRNCDKKELFKAEIKVDKAPLRNSMEHNTNKNVIQHLKKGTKLSIVERHNNEWWSAPQGYINKNDCKRI